MVVVAITGPSFAKPVGIEKAETLLQQPEVWILDVRSADEFALGRFEGAHQIPVQDLEVRKSELPDDKNVPLFVYCRSGKRSEQAFQILAKQGYAKIYTLQGGLQAWVAAGKKTVKEEGSH